MTTPKPDGLLAHAKDLSPADPAQSGGYHEEWLHDFDAAIDAARKGASDAE